MNTEYCLEYDLLPNILVKFVCTDSGEWSKTTFLTDA